VKFTKPILCLSDDQFLEYSKKMDLIYLRKPKSVYHASDSFYYYNRLEELFAVVTQTQEDLICKLYDNTSVNVTWNAQAFPSLQTGDVISFASNTNGGYTISHLRKDINWENYRNNFLLPYSIAKGINRSGNYPSCRGCSKKFMDKEELRMQVWCTFTPRDANAYRAKSVMCINPTCIELAINKKSSPILVHIPKFEGKVRVPYEMKDCDLPPLEGFDFIRDTNG